eukprot:scaffold42570_cov31-Tisochrysis_lutea.AAC.2
MKISKKQYVRTGLAHAPRWCACDDDVQREGFAWLCRSAMVSMIRSKGGPNNGYLDARMLARCAMARRQTAGLSRLQSGRPSVRSPHTACSMEPKVFRRRVRSSPPRITSARSPAASDHPETEGRCRTLRLSSLGRWSGGSW